MSSCLKSSILQIPHFKESNGGENLIGRERCRNKYLLKKDIIVSEIN